MASGVQFEKWLKNGFELYKGSAALLIVTTLLAALLANITIGILAGPMVAGLLMVTLRLRDRTEPVPQIGDLFKGFEHFVNSFLLMLLAGVIIFVVYIVMLIAAMILGLIPILGSLAAFALYLLVTALVCVLSLVVWFALCLMVDQGKDLKASIIASTEKVKGDFWNFAGFAIVASLAASAGILLCGVGILVTLPFYACAVTVAYRDLWGDGEGAEETPSADENQEPAASQRETKDETAEAAPDEQSGGEEEEEKPPPAG